MRKILAVLLIFVALPAQPAQAVPGSTWVHDVQSLVNGQDAKFVKAHCPPGEYLQGMGGTTNPAGHILTGIVPNEELTEVTVTARRQPGIVQLWSVTARAVCGPASNYRKTGSGATEAKAECNDSDIVYSSGFSIQDSSGLSYVTSVVPSGMLYDVSVTAVATSVVAIAICGQQIQNKARTSEVSSLDSSPSKQALAGKPQMQQDFGSAIFGGGIVIRATNAFVDGFGPNETLDGFLARASKLGVASSAKASAMTDDSWDTVTYGTCIGHWYAIPV